MIWDQQSHPEIMKKAIKMKMLVKRWRQFKCYAYVCEISLIYYKTDEKHLQSKWKSNKNCWINWKTVAVFSKKIELTHFFRNNNIDIGHCVNSLWWLVSFYVVNWAVLYWINWQQQRCREVARDEWRRRIKPCKCLLTSECYADILILLLRPYGALRSNRVVSRTYRLVFCST